jgi:chromosome segregation ATPase
MIEAILTGVVSLVIGASGGMAALNSRTSNKVADLDRRIDQMELRVAEKYVPRNELSNALQKMEDHMIRIENKLDQIALRSN